MSEETMSPVGLVLTAVAVFSDVEAAYESAGCSDQGCGIPCYLKPPGDECHYNKHSPCGEGSGEGGAADLDIQLSNLNDSLVRLEEKLIQKNIIPGGTSCHSLESIENGGIIYTDLILSIGVLANYVCFNGFSLHGHGTYECSSDSQWIRLNDQSTWKDTDVPTCENSTVVCEALVSIPSGHISYHTVDTTVVHPGDVAHYSCDTLYKLQGDSLRICLSNGSWSGEEPVCIAPPTSVSTEGHHKQDENKGPLVAEVIVPVVTSVTVVATIIIIAVIIWRRKRKNRSNYSVIAESVNLSSSSTKELESQEDESFTHPATIRLENK